MQRVIAHRETKYIQDCEEGVVIENNIEMSNINTEATIVGYVATEFEAPIEVIPVENVPYNIEIQNELNSHEDNYIKNRMFISLIFLSVILIIAIRKSD